MNEMIISLASVVGVLACYVAIFVMLGLILTAPIRRYDFHPSLQIGASFFLGSLIFYFIFLLNYTLGFTASDSLWATLILLIGFILKSILTHKLNIIKIEINWLILLLCFIFFIVFIFRSLSPMPEYFVNNPSFVNPYEGFGGVVHSFRAGNISEYIVTQDVLPRTGQHIGQSILASLSMMVVGYSAQIALVIWLYVGVIFGGFFIYGFSKIFISNSALAYVPLIFMCLGNTVFSIWYSDVVDTGNALLFTRSIDALYGMFYFILFIFALFLNNKRRLKKKNIILFVIIFSFVCVNVSVQMIILSLVVILVDAIIYAKEKYQLPTKLLMIGSILLSTLVGTSIFGGMLSSSRSLQDISSIPGAMVAKRAGEVPVEIRFPRTTDSSRQTPERLGKIYNQLVSDMRSVRASNFQNLSQAQNDKTSKSSNLTFDSYGQTPIESHERTGLIENIKSNALTYMAAKIIRSFQVVFFPLAGLIFCWRIIKIDFPSLKHIEFFKYILMVASILFFLGWFISSFFKYYGYYWELSRFFYPGIFLSMLLGGIAATSIFYNNTVTKFKFYIIASLFIFSIFGTFADFFIVTPLEVITLPYGEVVHAGDNSANLSYRTLTIRERFDFLINTNSIFGSDIKFR